MIETMHMEIVSCIPLKEVFLLFWSEFIDLLQYFFLNKNIRLNLFSFVWIDGLSLVSHIEGLSISRLSCKEVQIYWKVMKKKKIANFVILFMLSYL